MQPPRFARRTGFVTRVLESTRLIFAAALLPVQIGTLDVNREIELSATLPSGLAGVTLKLQSYALRRAGRHGVIDSSPETISIY